MTIRKLDSGFTLIELLMVIVIITCLAALLLPAINLVRNSAIKASCASRLGQIGLSLYAYSQDNRGIFPPIAGDVWHATYNWGYAGTIQGFAFLSPDYLSPRQMFMVGETPFNKVLTCPAYPNFDGQFGYAYNGNLRKYVIGSCWDPPAQPWCTSMPFAVGPSRNGFPELSPSNIVLAHEHIEDSTDKDPFHPHPKDFIRRPGSFFPLVPGGNVLYVDMHVR